MIFNTLVNSCKLTVHQ